MSDIFYNDLSKVPELYPVRSQGAMYMLVSIKHLHSADIYLTIRLLALNFYEAIVNSGEVFVRYFFKIFSKNEE